MKSDLDKTEINCKFCNRDISQSKEIRTNNIINNEEFYFYYCNECHALSSQNYDRSNLYERDRDNTNYTPSNQSLFSFLKYNFIKLSNRKFLNKDLKNKKVLDYGCGNGDFANICFEYMADSFAYDVQEDKPKTLNKNITYFNNKNFNSSSEKFDLIFARHVLEHVPSPPETIKLLLDKLQANGKLIIEVPNLDSINRKFMGKFWTGFFSPYHETVFSRKTFNVICSDLMVNYEIRNAEPFVFGVFLMHLGLPRNIARVFSFLCYPIQIFVSKMFKTSEAIICIVQKPK